MVRRFILGFVCCLLLPTSWAAEFNASVDRTQLPLNEPLLFSLTLTNSDTRLRAEGVDPNVDLTLLSDNFNLGRPEASNTYNIYLGQGRSTSEIKVELFPKRSGTLIIPAFEIDGLTTKPIQIEVLSKTTALPDEVFVRSGTTVESPWVGQQVVAYVDLYHRVELKSASLGSNFETEPVQIELLPNWKMPQAIHQEKVQGIEYEVERIAWAVFPNQAGPFTVQLPDIWITTKTDRQLRLPQQRLDFEVKPLPADLPADIIIGKPELTAGPLPDHFKQHELSEWTLTLKAPVAVTALPKFLPGIELPKGLKLYPDPARYHTEQTSAGIMDAADYTLSIMPLFAGEYELPPIRVPYFDPDSGRAALVELPGQNITVAAGAIPQPDSVLAAEPTASTTVEQQQGISSDRRWQLATAVMTLLWLTTLLRLWRQQNRSTLAPAPVTARPRPQDQRHPLQQKLLSALESQTLEQGLQRWQVHQPEDNIVEETIRALQRYCYGHGQLSENELQTKVEAAIARIRRTSITNASNEPDPWRTESFFPGGQ